MSTHTRRVPPPPEGGFTLLETVVAMSMLAVLTLGMCSAFIVMMRINDLNRHRSLARAAARAQLQDLIAIGGAGLEAIYGDLTGSPASYTFTLTADQVGTGTLVLRPQDGETEVGVVTLTELEEAPPLVHAQITVTWQDSNGPASFTLTTLLTDRDQTD